MQKSRFLIGFLGGNLVGIFLGDILKIDLWWLAGFSIGLVVALVIFWHEKYLRLSLFALIGLFIGLGYFQAWDIRQRSVILPIGEEISFEGRVVDHPDFSASQARYRLSFHETKIQITSGRYPEYAFGDKLQVKGTVKKSNDYYFHQGVLGVVNNPEIEKIGEGGKIITKTLYQIRDRFEDSLNRSLSEPYASFAAGLLLGSRRNIPDSLLSDFNRTGTTHIVAVSGYNVTIIIINIGLLLGLFSRRWRFWGSLLAILAFVVLTGAPASVVRAGLLAGLIAWGRYEGRRINILILLLFTASLMLLFNPYALKYDISFELSFLAFIGLVYFSPLFEGLKIFRFLPEIIKSALSETLGAQLMVLPILIYNFGQLSLVSPLANVLILWLVPFSMLAVFLVGIFGLIWFPLGKISGFLGFLFLKYIIVAVEGLSKISWASLPMKVSGWWWVAVFYGLTALLIVKFKSRKGLEKI